MRKEDTILAVVRKPGKPIERKEISNTLEQFQSLVNGYIEIIPFPGMADVDVLLNEEGKLEGLKPNIYVPEYIDLVVGPIVILGFNEELGEFISLTEEQIKRATDYIKKNDASGYKGLFEEYLGISVTGDFQSDTRVGSSPEEESAYLSGIDKYVERTNNVLAEGGKLIERKKDIKEKVK